MKKKHTVIFQPSGKRGQVESGITVRDAAVYLGEDIKADCGAQAACGKCRVRISESTFDNYGIVSDRSHLSPVDDDEKQFLNDAEEEQGYRLACRAKVFGDIIVFVPEESRTGNQIIRKTAGDIEVNLNPAVKIYYLEMTGPLPEDSTADGERLLAELKRKHNLDGLTIDYPVLSSLPQEIRRGEWKVSVFVWQEREVIKVVSGNVKRTFGVAADIGTTTLAGYLFDLSSGELVATESMMNPQVVYGEDLMSRIGYIMNDKDGLVTLNKVIIDGLNTLLANLCVHAGISAGDILDMTAVGNTCMHHILLNIDPRFIAEAPFVAAVRGSYDIKARDIGINPAPAAYIHFLPVEAGFVGSDNVAVLLTEKPHEQDDIELIIDIGTNGELVLGNRERLISCSCATGPAFEGAEIKHGIRAVPGAIESIAIDRDTLEVDFRVIAGDTRNDESKNILAKGICGSGIIDVVPQLFMAGIIDRTGKFIDKANSPRLRVTNGMAEFVIAWADETAAGRDITICQNDIRAIQLAKAAMYAGVKIMMKKLGVEKIDRIVLTGAFGNYIDKESAALLGLFPDCDIDRISSTGNAAGDGACLALLDINKRAGAEEISRRVEYVELSAFPEFERMFAEAMWLPHMKDEFPHLNHKTWKT